jgi:hypothetical protein
MRVRQSIVPSRAVLALMACSVLLPGCEALSPTQLWKLNRHPRESYGGDAYFSIPNGESASAQKTAENNAIPQVAAF